MGASLEEPIEDGLGKIGIMQYLTERGQRLVGGDEDRSALQVPNADDAEEDVGGIRGVALVPEFVDDQDVRVHVGFERLLELAAPGGERKVTDQLIGGGEASLEAVLDCPVGDGDGQMRLSATGRTGDEGPSPLAHELRAEQCPQHLEPHRVLEREVELLDGAEEGKPRLADRSGDPRLCAMGDLLADEDLQEAAVAHSLRLRAECQLRVEPPYCRQVETLQHGVEVGRVEMAAHEAASAARRTTYSAP